MKKSLFLLIPAILLSTTINAQGTFNRVYNIIQTNCAVTCHTVASPDGDLVMTGTEADVYSALVGAAPKNSTAASKEYKTVWEGYPDRSFLMRKISNDFDSTLLLGTGEGTYMPLGGGNLTMVEKELIRQWILYGAPDTGTVVDEQILVDFYDNGLGKAKIHAPQTPEQLGLEGAQIRIGPFFLLPNQEVEYFKKDQLDWHLDGDVDVVRTDAEMNVESHHFALFDLDPAQAYPSGLNLVDEITDQIVVHLSATEVGAWNEDKEIPLPAGTAYKWPEETVMLMDYHIKNSNQTEILAAEVYVNIFTEPQSTTRETMNLMFPNFGGLNPFILQIPPTGQPFTETMIVREPGSSELWKVWRAQGHTHSIGIDFDMFLRNPDGSKGDQVYDGFYNSDYSFYQGFYDYAHAPVKVFDPFLEVEAKHGFIFEATYQNNTSDTITFGITTEDEMFAGYLHFLKEDIVSAGPEIIKLADEALTLYPSPASSFTTIQVPESITDEVTIRVFNISGSEVFRQENISDKQFTLDVSSWNKGMYLVELINNNVMYTNKLVVE